MPGESSMLTTVRALVGEFACDDLQVLVGPDRGEHRREAAAVLVDYSPTTLLETWSVKRATGDEWETFQCYRDRRVQWVRAGNEIGEVSDGYVWVAETHGAENDAKKVLASRLG